jgi:hypothetical protein
MTTEEQERTYTTQVAGQAIADNARKLVHEGSVRQLVVRKGDGRTVLEMPVIAGVVAGLVAPVVSAVAVIAALSGGWAISIERRHEEKGTSS